MLVAVPKRYRKLIVLSVRRLGYKSDIVRACGLFLDNYLGVWALFLDLRSKAIGPIDIFGFLREPTPDAPAGPNQAMVLWR
jgi:hypothetical protein